MADITAPQQIDGLWELFTAYLDAESVELDDLEVLGGGGGRIVRVVVDAPGGVGVDHIAELSRALSRLLDEHDPFDGAYTLEVTSPGLERKLRRPAHYTKSIGRSVTIKTTKDVAGQRRHDGSLTASNDAGVTVDVDGERREIPFDVIDSARTVFEWTRNPKPGKKTG